MAEMNTEKNQEETLENFETEEQEYELLQRARKK